VKNKILLLIISLAFSVSLHAGECTFKDMKLNKDIVFGFFNGVMTSKKEAKNALDLIRTKFINSSTTNQGESIEYVLFYNKTEGFADFAETFEQRAQEHAKVFVDKYEYFWKIHNQSSDSILEKLKKEIPALGDLIKADLQGALALSIDGWVNLFDRSKTTDIMYQNHKEKIDCIESKNKKFLILAHSQGNLFGAKAFRYALNRDVNQSAAKIVHIAPALPNDSLLGIHFLADKDLVINGLVLTGSKPSITHTIPGYFIEIQDSMGKQTFLAMAFWRYISIRHLMYLSTYIVRSTVLLEH